MQRTINVEFPPRRIISLVPSQTELLYDLGLEKEVVGITKFCVHPDKWFRQKNRVGGTKQLKLEKIAELKPDLILGNKEENDRGQIEQLAKQYPVWMSNIVTLMDALDMIEKIGELVGRELEAGRLVEDLQQSFEELRSFPGTEPTHRVAYFIWRKPWMVAANGTFIHDMLQRAGFENVFAHQSRYPEIALKELEALSPDVILLSSEPYPFIEKHLEEFKAVCPTAIIRLVDGELFSWYGSRLLKAPAYFQELQTTLNQMN